MIGSVKPNICHLGPASGIAGLIKVALSLHHQRIPPTIGPQKLNSAVHLADGQLAVPDRVTPLPDRDGPALAGVTALSLGGVNAHAVLASSSQPPRAPVTGRAFVLPLSARSRPAINALADTYAEFLAHDHTALLSDICFTASVGRTHHDHRLAVVGGTKAELIAALTRSRRSHRRVASVVWAFGDGPASWSDADRTTLLEERAFVEMLAQCDASAVGLGTSPVRAIFADQLAFAALLASWGLRPDVIVARGVGRAAAAVTFGAMALATALRCTSAVGADPEGEVEQALAHASVPLSEETHADDVVIALGSTADGRYPTSSFIEVLEVLADLYCSGRDVDWRALWQERGRVTSLPNYCWQRQPLWPTWLDVDTVSRPPASLHRRVLWRNRSDRSSFARRKGTSGERTRSHTFDSSPVKR